MRTAKRRSYILAVILALIIGVSGFFAVKTEGKQAAAATVYPYDQTILTEDLEGMDLTGYSTSMSAPTLITLLEYGYIGKRSPGYALYAYVYNPKSLTFSTATGSNYIEMESGENYEKLPLVFCTRTTDGTVYKYRIKDDAGTILTRAAAEDATSGKRTYSVSSVELWTVGARNANDYAIGRVYEYTGTDKESDLTVSTLETVDLNVHSTYYRTAADDIATFTTEYRDQINSVYFTIPKEYFKSCGGRYDGIAGIRAEWYEFVTSNIFVTNDFHFNNGYLFYTGAAGEIARPQPATAYSYICPQPMSGKNYYEGFNLEAFGYTAGNRSDSKVLGTTYYDARDDFYPQTVDPLAYSFWVNSEDITSYDPYKTTKETGGISSETLQEYMFGVTPEDLEYLSYADPSTFGKAAYLVLKALSTGGVLEGTYERIGDKIVPYDLFLPDIQESRKKNDATGVIRSGWDGKSLVDISVDDVYKIESGAGSGSALEKWFFYLLNGKDYTQRDEYTLDPIVTVDPSEAVGKTSNQIIDKYKIAADNVEEFRETCRKAVEGDELVILFRFAKTDYRTQRVEILTSGLAGCPGCAGENGNYGKESYIANETVFMDFDTISISFNDGEKKVTYAAVSDPTDIVPGVTPGTGMDPIFDGKPKPEVSMTIVIVAIACAAALTVALIITLRKKKKGSK